MQQTLNYTDFTIELNASMFPDEQQDLQKMSSSPTTNTLVVTGISRFFFQNPPVISILERHFQHFGRIHSWVPLPSFGRIMVVYYDDHDAERAKQDFDYAAPTHTHDWYVLVNPCPSHLHTD